jgi:hypothetical protein
MTFGTHLVYRGKTDFAKFDHRLRIGPIGVYFNMVMNIKVS